MNTKRSSNIWGCLIVACFVTSLSVAQDKIADDDLLKMLENANTVESEEVEQPADAPVAATEPVVEEPVPAVTADEPDVIAQTASATVIAGERADEADAVMQDDIPDDMAEPETEAVENEDDALEAVALVEDDEIIDDVGMVTYDAETASSNDELISVRLNRVSLEEAINLFAQLSGANIIVPELTEAAQISVNLKDVEWRPALQSILDSYNYELYQKVSGSNVFSVRRRPAGAPEPQVVETFMLRYATVPNAAALVETLLPEDAKISQFASRNMLVIKSTESSLSEVRSVLQTIDTIRQQVFIESKFMELNDRAQKQLGIDWQVLSAYGIGTSGSIEKSYTKTDSERTESSSYTDALGRPYAEGEGFVDGDTLDGNFPVYEGLTPAVKSVSSGGSAEVLTTVLEADEFRLILSALEDNAGVNVVSNPKIIVANEERANIAIVRKEPNIKQERQQTAGAQGGAAIDNIVYELDPETPFFEYGIKLNVTPSINTSSNITVAINPSLTRFVGEKPAGDNTYPIIDEKSINTVFNLSSGQTAAIGGLTEVSDQKIERKVPVLGSIPYLGRLFSWEKDLSEQKETIIFVTVGLANTQNIDTELGLPEDSELARRRLIRDHNKRILREQGRKYYQIEEDDRLDDSLRTLEENEAKRQERRVDDADEQPQNVASVD